MFAYPTLEPDGALVVSGATRSSGPPRSSSRHTPRLGGFTQTPRLEVARKARPRGWRRHGHGSPMSRPPCATRSRASPRPRSRSPPERRSAQSSSPSRSPARSSGIALETDPGARAGDRARRRSAAWPIATARGGGQPGGPRAGRRRDGRDRRRSSAASTASRCSPSVAWSGAAASSARSRERWTRSIALQLEAAGEILRQAVRTERARCVTTSSSGAPTRCASADLCRRRGRVTNLIGLVHRGDRARAPRSARCARSRPGATREPVPPEVVGFRAGRTLLMPLGETDGIGPGTARRRRRATRSGFAVGDELLGRVLDGLGRPIDGGADRRPPRCGRRVAAPPAADDRPRIDERARARRARAGRARAVRPRPAARHLRRLGRRQVHAARA